jgi:hypothetical protein
MGNVKDVVIIPYNVQECEILLLENDVTRSRHVEYVKWDRYNSLRVFNLRYR